MKSPKELHERSLELLSERGVDIEQIADLVYFLQEKYVPLDITFISSSSEIPFSTILSFF